MISKYGYSISKKGLNIDEISDLKQGLTLSTSNPLFPGSSKKYHMYVECKNWIRIPRFFGLTKFGIPNKNLLKTIRDRKNFDFLGTLKPAQIRPFQVISDKLNKDNMATLCLMTGSGKTVIAVSLMCDIKTRTCVIVNKSMLAEQWKTEINRFSPSTKVEIIQGCKSTYLLSDDSIDVCIVMAQTISNMKVVDAMFGLMIVDECHHLPCKTFSDIMFKCCCSMVLALSATPERQDGLSVAIEWHVGKITYKETPNRNEQKPTEIVLVNAENEGIEFDPKNYSRMITRLCNDKTRNDIIVNTINPIIKDTRRHVLIITERAEHVKTLRNLLDVDNDEIGVFISKKRKRDDNDVPLSKRIIISTYKMMEEGISVGSLNTLVLASPKKNIVQTLGRIYRKIHVDINPLIIDVVDSILQNQANQRMKIYKNELHDNFTVSST